MFLEIIQNKIVLSCFFAWFLAQFIKGIVFGVRNKKFEFKYFWTNGSMPSSHSSLVTALTFSIFFEQGVSALFIVSLIFSLIVMRDACGVRLSVEKNTEVINKLAKKKFNTNIGHEFKEVLVGALIGVVVPIVIYLLI